MRQVVVPAKRSPKWVIAGVLGLLAGVAVAVIDPFANRQALNDEQLDSLRGGYESAQGLVFSFGIERAVVVNGELLATTRLVIDNFGALLAGQPGALTVVTETVVQGPPAPTSVAAAPSSPSAVQAVSGGGASQPAQTSIASALGGTPVGGAAANSASATGSYGAIPSFAPQSQVPIAAASGASVPSAPSVTSIAPVANPVSAPAGTPAPVTTASVATPTQTTSPAAASPGIVTTSSNPGLAASPAPSTPTIASTLPAATAGAPASSPANNSSTANPPGLANAPSSGMGGTPVAANTAPSQPISGSPQPVTAAPASSPSAASAQTAPQTAPSSSATASGPPALYVQVNAAGAVILVPNGAAIAASVQNSANDVRIQTITQIDAVLSSLSAYRANVFADAMRQAASVRQ